jgi:hypothetical protein
MAIWRGAGGPGDATTDAANEASVASTKAAEAAASASAAAGSATSAANSATNAANSATASATSASNSASSASSASSSASSASTSASNASSSASAASTAQGYAEEWATKAEDSLISTAAGGDGSTDYSSLHHAAKASASASAAASSASAASSSASAAQTAQTNAETAETNAETAQTAAEAARDAALAALDNFDDRYLGEKASDPTLDNDGDALVAGALYFNTTSNIMKVYTGSAWVAAYVSGSIDIDSITDVTITSVADNEVLAYDSTSSKWINQTAAEAGLVATSDIGSTVQAYDATILVDADIGVNVQAYSSVLQNTTASYTTAEETKLAGIETAADVTDATNVAAAGAVMDTNFSTNGLMKRTGAGTYTIVTDNSSEWNTAYSWGNHASAGYLTSYTETDPVYTASSWYTTTNNSTNWDTAYGWGNHASAGYLTNINSQSIEDLSDVNTMTPSDGQLLTWDNANSRWDAADAPVSLPSQTGHAGEYLTTDGSTASWAAVSSNTTSNGLYEHANTISSNYTITSGNNALSAGTMTINSGVTVTVPTGSTWTIV